MATTVIMPKLSPTMEEGQIARWLKKEGESVTAGEPLAEIDTDKATMEMQSLTSGVLRKILIKEGDAAPLGQVIAIVGTADEDIAALLDSAGSEAAKTPSKSEPVATAASAPEPATPQGTNGSRGEVVAATSGRLIVSTIGCSNGGRRRLGSSLFERQWSGRTYHQA